MMELHVFDFDGTLFKSPMPPPWWDGGSWFVQEISLDAPCVPERPGSDWWVSSVVSQARKSASDPNVYAIVCTGRSAMLANFRHRLPKMIQSAGLRFDEVLLNPGGPTPNFKASVVDKFVNNGSITAVHMWDDDEKNLAAVGGACAVTGVPFFGHHVPEARGEVECGPEAVIELINQGVLPNKILRKIRTAQDDMTQRVAARWLGKVAR